MAFFNHHVRKGHLLVYDSMAAPGQPLSLLADLVEEGVLTQEPLGGEVLRFQVAGRSLGMALTGGDGRAVKPYIPHAVGVMDLTVRLGNARRVTASEARARIFVWDRRRSVIIVSHAVLQARSRGPALGLPIPDFGGPPQAPDGAMVKALWVLSGRVHLLYVAPIDRTQLPDIRQWMDQYRLPAGPLFLVKAIPLALAHQVETWRRDGWNNIKGGLAGTPDEAHSLLDKGLKAVIPPGASSKEKWPDKTIMTKDWTDVVKQLAS